MAMCKKCYLQSNYNFLLNLFTATMVLMTFILVTYTLLLPSRLNIRLQKVTLMLTEHRLPSRGNLDTSSFLMASNLTNLSLVASPLVSRSKRFRRHKTPPILPLSEAYCKESYCSDLLTDSDLARFKSCSEHARNNTKVLKKKKCHFINQTGRDPVALVSLPGSGNTWVRGLLEKATGVCTGAPFCDISLRAYGFIGENIRSGKVLVVKTHDVKPKWKDRIEKVVKLDENEGMYGSAILIVRNPFDALVSEWNRKVANQFHRRTVMLDSHTRAVGIEWFGKNEKWDKHIQKQIARWRGMIENWLIFNRKKPVLVVKYEALKKQTFHEVEWMLKFMNVYYNAMTLNEVLRVGFNAFKREHNHSDGVKYFTDRQRRYITRIIMNVDQLLKKHKKSHQLRVYQYLI